MEAELESMTRKSHDASGQLVHISQELLKKERYGRHRRRLPWLTLANAHRLTSAEHRPRWCSFSRLTELLVFLSLKPGV